MHSLMSTNTYSIESWIYNDINCQFAICKACFWSATVFKSAEQHNKNNKSDQGIFHTCPISLITIANDIFRKKEVDKMSGMFLDITEIDMIS
jgi:hypothetical protein